jgi:SAM-dependent methyltransferase
MNVDQDKLKALAGRMVGDIGAAISAVLVHLGDRLGLYRALADGGPQTSEALAKRTGLAERYLREWLAAQAAAGYIGYDPASGAYSLDPEQQMVFAVEGNPAFMAGAFQLMAALWRDEPKIAEAFRTGKGVGWHEHDHALFHGTERFFRPAYAAHLVDHWLPALDGVVDRLKAGGRVADVGCGHGASTILMAKAFPNARFTGFDYHPPSIERARALAEEAGLGDRVTFEVAPAKAFPGSGYDLVTFFDCLHDMGDPVGAAAHVRQALKPDGTWMVVEPLAGDQVQDNLNPVGRIYYAASTMVCTPASLAQEVGLALGAQAGETRLRKVLSDGGFTRVRRATDSAFNMVLEARP